MNLSDKGNEHVSIGFHNRREQRLIGREIFRSYLPGPVDRFKSIAKALIGGKFNQFSEITIPSEELPTARDSAEQQGRALMSELLTGTVRVVPELTIMSNAVAEMNAFLVRSSVSLSKLS